MSARLSVLQPIPYKPAPTPTLPSSVPELVCVTLLVALEDDVAEEEADNDKDDELEEVDVAVRVDDDL